MPLPTHQDGVENRDKAYCRFASPIYKKKKEKKVQFAIISYLTERNIKLIIT